MSTIYTEADYSAIVKQQHKRWLILAVPCVILTITLIVSLIIRLEWLTAASTIFIGVLLIAGYDLFIKPLHCYERHLKNCIHGRTRECDLPFIRLSENIDVVDGVRYHQLLCADTDGKGRPYERLFYFDAEKTFPDVNEGDMLHIVHHDLVVANICHA
nr:hypothetical protein [Clostridia bacterium]